MITYFIFGWITPFICINIHSIYRLLLIIFNIAWVIFIINISLELSYSLILQLWFCFNWAWCITLHYLCKWQICCCFWLWAREGNIIKLTTFWNGHCIRSVYDALKCSLEIQLTTFWNRATVMARLLFERAAVPFQKTQNPTCSTHESAPL